MKNSKILNNKWKVKLNYDLLVYADDCVYEEWVIKFTCCLVVCVPIGILRIEIRSCVCGSSCVCKAKSSDSKCACCDDLMFGYKYRLSHKFKIKWVIVYFGIVLLVLEIESISIDTLLDCLL